MFVVVIAMILMVSQYYVPQTSLFASTNNSFRETLILPSLCSSDDNNSQTGDFSDEYCVQNPDPSCNETKYEDTF